MTSKHNMDREENVLHTVKGKRAAAAAQCPWQGACTVECRSALGLTAKLVPKLMRVQMAMAWPLTRAGKISPIITHEMGPKLICNSNETLIALERCPELQNLRTCAHGTAGRWHACAGMIRWWWAHVCCLCTAARQ